MYITHRTHGAGVRLNKTQAPTATRLTTPNADQCLHQPRGRQREEQVGPSPKNKGGGAQEKPTATKPPTDKRRPNPPARWHRGREAEGTPEDHPAKTGDTQPRAAAHGMKEHPEHGDTHLARAGTEKKPTHEGAARTRGEGATVSTRPKTGTASDGHHEATTRHYTTPPPQKKKKSKGRRGTNPTHSNTGPAPRHGRPPRR